MFSTRFRWELRANRLSSLLEEKRRAGASIIDLTEANPTRAGFAYPHDEILNALSQAAAMSYEPTPKGLPTARAAVAAYYAERGLTVAPEQIHLTASTSEGYSFLFKLLADQNQAVLVPQPSYPLFDFLAALEGVALRPYELHYLHPGGWRIDFDSLLAALTADTRAVILVNPNNPTGSFVKRAEVAQLNEICARHGLALIVDEVFGDYACAADERRAASLVNNDGALTFVLNGLSKILALPQMKLGWIVTSGPQALRRAAEERLDLIADTFLSVSTPVQHAVPHWLKLRGALQRQILARVQTNLRLLAQLTAGTSCRLLHVEGGWYAVLEVPRNLPEEEMVLTLLGRDDVLVHPGYFFDFPREAYLILSLLPRPEAFAAAADHLLTRI